MSGPGSGLGSRGGRAAVLRRLDAEWVGLAADDEAGAACRRWAVRCPALAGCGRPGDVLARVAGDPDTVLGHLLGQVADGDALAGRVVLHALVPKMVLMASRDAGATVDDYLTALWCEIATYPLARRPRSVAANLVLDTLRSVRDERGPSRLVATSPRLVTLAADERPEAVVGAAPPAAGPTAAAVLVRATRRRLVDARTGALLHSVYAEGLSGASAAERHGLSAGAVRVRCSRAVRVLAQNAHLLGVPA